MGQTDSAVAPVEMSAFARNIYQAKYAWKDADGNPTEEWPDTAKRVVTNVMSALGYDYRDQEFRSILKFVTERKFMPGGRYLYATGRPLHQTQNCLLLKAEDTREGWADLSAKAEMALMTGAGIGVDYSDLRHSGSAIKKTGGVSSGPLAKMNIINEIGRNVMQGGARRSAIWAGLSWKHADVFKFMKAKAWPEAIVKMKAEDFTFPAPLDFTNISVILDDEFFEAFDDVDHKLHLLADEVYHFAVSSMIRSAEPGLSVDTGPNAGETLRNACTEITSADDSDICNLGSVNLARIESLEEFRKVVELGTLFLLAGTVYSDLPYPKVAEVRRKNRRLGLGLLGIHEWLLQREKTYGPDPELEKWLEVYSSISRQSADEYSSKHALSNPVKVRAIAPTGTIGIVAETTTGIEPIMNAAYKRRVREATPDGDIIRAEYVVDPTARRLIDKGVDPELIEDAYTLSYDVERRIAFQAWVQRYVDHGISSTINLPYAITDDLEVESFKNILMKYLPDLRGMTCYPDGAISGQPITPVPLDFALSQEGVIIEESEDKCRGNTCGA